MLEKQNLNSKGAKTQRTEKMKILIPIKFNEGMIFTKVPLCGLVRPVASLGTFRLCAFAVKTTIQNSEEP
jgi:hypothetical protein